MSELERATDRRKVVGFGKWLRRERLKRRVTQINLAEVLGTSQRTVSDYEKGDYVFDEDQTLRIAKLFGMDRNECLRAAGYAEEPPAEEEPEAVSDVARDYGPPRTPTAPIPLRGLVLDYGAVRLAPTPAHWGDAPMLQYTVVTDTLGSDFHRGDTLLFEAGDSAEPGEMVIVHTRRGEHFYRYCGRTDRALLVGPANAPSPAHPTELPEATIVGVLLDQYRRHKKPKT